MDKTEVCPICGGSGKIEDKAYRITNGIYMKICHACGGSGYIRIKNKKLKQDKNDQVVKGE